MNAQYVGLYKNMLLERFHSKHAPGLRIFLKMIHAPGAAGAGAAEALLVIISQKSHRSTFLIMPRGVHVVGAVITVAVVIFPKHMAKPI